MVFPRSALSRTRGYVNGNKFKLESKVPVNNQPARGFSEGSSSSDGPALQINTTFRQSMVGGRFTTSKAPEAKRTSALEDLIRLKNEVESNKELKMASQARLINAKLQGKNLSKVSEQLSP
jgi:hypothetical protein